MESREIIRLGFVRSKCADTVIDCMEDMVRDVGFRPNPGMHEFRSPRHYYSWHTFMKNNIYDAQAYWHRDGMQEGERYMAIWASSFPTEIKLLDGTITSLKPFQVGLVDNRKVLHRTPAELMNTDNASRRYFARWNMYPLKGDYSPYLAPQIFRED